MSIDVLKLMETSVELDKELVPYLENSSIGFRMIRHPLVYALFYIEQMNNIYNEQLKYKKQAIKTAYDYQDWDNYIFLHERPYRFDALVRIFDEVKSIFYRSKLFADVWIDSENLWQVKHHIKYLLDKVNLRLVMDDKEKKLYDELPDKVTIYRGHSVSNKRGYSWTLSYFKANWFANRFSKGGYVTKGFIDKSNILGLLMGRNELEVIVRYEDIEDVQRFDIESDYNRIKKMALDNFKLNRDSIHGINHWYKVDYNIIKLCELNKDADLKVCRMFAYLHDCMRENDVDDEFHGERAADLLFTLKKKLNLSVAQFDTLYGAIRYHEKGLISDDATIGTCWDADRLDLVRVGIPVKKELLSTDVAKKLLWII